MDQLVWAYQAADNSFWVAREPVYSAETIDAPRPVLEIGTAEVEPFELTAHTRDVLAYVGVAKLAEGDLDAILLRLHPSAIRPPVLGLEYRLGR